MQKIPDQWFKLFKELINILNYSATAGKTIFLTPRRAARNVKRIVTTGTLTRDSSWYTRLERNFSLKIMPVVLQANNCDRE